MAIIHGTFKHTTNNKLLLAVRSLGFLDMEKGPWVAGGAVRRLLFDQDDFKGDIDIFVSSREMSERVQVMLRSRSDTEYVPIKACTEFKLESLKGGWFRRLQIIDNRIFQTAEDLINDFDLTVCMAATDGFTWIADDRLFRDIKNKELVLNNEDQRRKSLLRLAKYCRYGFTPKPGVFSKMINLDKIEKEMATNGTISVGNDY